MPDTVDRLNRIMTETVLEGGNLQTMMGLILLECVGMASELARLRERVEALETREKNRKLLRKPR